MHDIVDLESRGIPGVFVATVEFIAAGEAQIRALGPPVDAVHVAHPVQDRTDEEMIGLADSAYDQLVAALVEMG